MLFSGYQVGIHLLNSTFADVSLDREQTIKSRERVRVVETYLQNRLQSRNNIFEVEGNFKNNLRKVLVKQPRFDSPTHIASSLNEAYILALFKAAGFAQLATMIGYDPFQHLLFQRYVEHVDVDLDGEPDAAVFQDIARQLARLFSQIHSLRPNKSWEVNGHKNRLGYRKPMLLETTLRDLEELQLGPLPPEQKQVIDLLVADKCLLLRRIHALSWAQTALIHYDFKFAHVLFSDEITVATLIDWEMADVGDIGWDIASVWFELIRPFMYGDDKPSVLIDNSLLFLNEFLSHYQPTDARQLNPLKLQQFLGVLLLQKHFYGQLDDGLGVDKTAQWLQRARQLILRPDPNLSIPTGLVAHPVARLARFVPPPMAEHPFRGGDHFDSLKDIAELATLLVNDYRNGLPAPDADLPLAQYIYKWFNGNLGRSTDTRDQEQLAAKPKVGKEAMHDDLWWLVEGYAKNNRVVIRKNSERRAADPGAFIYQQHDARSSPRLALRSFVKLQFPQYVIRPNDAREDSNDFWILGQLPVRQDWANWVRFYVNLKRDAAGIHLFIELISQHLNERRIPFELKLRNALSSYTRTDVAILFMHRQHVNAALDTIAYVYNELKKGDYLDAGTPKFTRRFKHFDALAFAENPSEKSVSFGMLRATLIAENVADELTKPTVSVARVKATIKRTFQIRDFNVFELYRNPYPAENEYKYRFDLLTTKLGQPPLLNSSVGASVRYSPKQRFLAAARTVGFQLCREAVWYGSYCTWFCFKKDEGGQGYFETATEADLLGIALFVCQLAMACPQDRLFEDTARGILENGGSVGHKPLPTLRDDVVTRLQAMPLNAVMASRPSSVNAISDTNLFSDELVRLNSKSAFFADSLIERFVDKGIPFPNGYSESFNDTTRTEFNPTLTHGLTALGYFFLLLSNNPDRPVVPLSEVYASQTPILLPVGNFFS